ncbi:aminotransferase class I/II-fold pyridoxal phosphate-dependent enzyme [Pelagibacterales bacterium SAG-MED33]|nr:aminotransferase class I/II-fold pyridoxal phosphate-dependent enzyme [Pelagibacterales bacterium SAG-MED33]
MEGKSVKRIEINKNDWRFRGNENKYINQIIKNGVKKIPFNKILEKKWSKFHNIKYSITVNSCTSALHSAFLTILNKGDEVLVPALTPIMCGTSIHLAGGVPIYVDVSKKTFLIDYDDLERKITKKTKAVLAVHMYSGICNLKKLKDICKKNKLYLIEDCAESIGAYDENKILAGSAGDISCWSFQSAKQLTTGDGGILSTNKKNIAEKIRKFSNLGFKSLKADGDNVNLTKDTRQNPNFNRFEMVGYNYRMNVFTAALALAQLEKVEFFLEKRRAIGLKFTEVFRNNNNFSIQKINQNAKSSYYTFAAYLKNDKIGWKKFRKKFIQNGGDPIYAASKLISDEQAIKKNNIGRCFKNCKIECVKRCTGTPIAKYLQKKLFLFTTNQFSKSQINTQIKAIKKTINFFNLEKTINIGIFQGRLTKSRSKKLQSYPKDWKKEFAYLSRINCDYIEFFLEKDFTKSNPFWNTKKLKLIKKYLKEYNFSKFVLCDNYTLNHSLIENKTIIYIQKILENLGYFKKSKLIIPIQKKDILNENVIFYKNLKKILEQSNKENIEISFETNDLPKKIGNLLKKFPKAGITFDTGNIFLATKNVASEFKKLSKHVNHIHIKNRDKGGNNVQLSKGLINFKSFFNELKKNKYSGEITLETARGNVPIENAIQNINYVRDEI